MKTFLILFLFYGPVAYAVDYEQPPFESKDPGVTENFRNIYYGVNEVGLQVSSMVTANYLTASSATVNFLTLSSATATYLQLSSATATYLQLSSASATYLQSSSATATYLPLSSATLNYIGNTNTLQSGYKFNVSSGTASLLYIGDGSGTAPGISFRDDPDSGMYRLGANHIGFSVGGSADAIDISAGGRVTQFYQTSFLVTNSAGQTNLTGDATDATITWGNEIYDQDSSISNSTFTAPVAGRYLLTASVTLREISTAMNNRTMYIKTSNRNYRQNITQIVLTAFDYLPFSMSVIADMDANDTAYVTVQLTAGARAADVAADAEMNHFSGSLIN